MNTCRLPHSHRGPLYKYLPREYAEKMVQEGSVRIGTLSYFRNLEDDAARGDAEEGHRRELLHVEKATVTENGTFHSKLIDRFIRPAPGSQVVINNAVFEEIEVSDDFYVYCLSSEYDATALTSFGDACVRIDDPDLFFDTVTRSMGGLTTGERSVLPVVYKKKSTIGWIHHSNVPGVRVMKLVPPGYGWQIHLGYGLGFEELIDWTDTLHPLWIKDPSFSAQKEVRVIWTPALRPIQPINILNPDIARSCSLLASSTL